MVGAEMEYERLAPPKHKGDEYARAAQSAAGDWVRIPLGELTGTDRNAKRAGLRQACALRGVLVETRTDSNFMYMRLRGGE